MQIRFILLLLTVVSLFALLTVGAYVTVAGAGDACGSNLGQDYPLCLGHLFPPLQLAPIAEYTHRLLASLSSLFLFVATFLFWRTKDSPRSARRSLYLASFLIVVEVILGAAVVATTEPAWLVTLHQANALLVFGLTVSALAIDRHAR
ncbi:MAG: COX15/CtaA family protein [Nitrososphaerales archaeon]